MLFVLLLPGELRADPLEAGRRIYREGVLPSGRALQATVSGDVALRGGFAACAKCHRHSGFGWSEGEVIAPPVTRSALFGPREDRRADLLRNLYQEVHGPRALAAMRTPRHRPAYDRETLAQLLREGIDSTGRVVDRAMPRYGLAGEEMAALIDYLETLGDEPAPGVQITRIRFATVVAGDVDADRRQAMADVIEAFVRRKNKEVERELGRPGFSPYFKDHYRSARRAWQVDLWELSGGQDDWRRQLEARYRAAPIFAMLSGLASGDWRPIHEFCQRHAVPCLFPNTNLPSLSGPNDQTLYLSKGLVAEAQVLAHWLKHRSPQRGEIDRVVQVHRDTVKGRRLAKAFEAAMDGPVSHNLISRVIDSSLAPGASFWTRLISEEMPSALVIWLRSDDLVALNPVGDERGDRPQLYFSGGLLASELPAALYRLPTKARLTYPYALPGREVPRIYRLRAWLRAQGIRRPYERIQLNTHFALSVTEHALIHMVDRFSRDYLIERVEHETESALNPGTFPHLSLGPGQRFGSRGSYIVAIQRTAKGLEIRAITDWVVP